MYSYSSRSAESKEHAMPDNATELLERPAETAGTDAGGTETAAVEIAAAETADVVAADLLVEEISIDGMCGVY
jgi:mycofactocin precursor